MATDSVTPCLTVGRTRLHWEATRLLPHHGVLVEIYGRSVHEKTFEEDHARQTTNDRLGFHWLTFTANQIARDRKNVRLAIESVMAQAQRQSRRAAEIVLPLRWIIIRSDRPELTAFGPPSRRSARW